MTARQFEEDDTETVAVFALQGFSQINDIELCGSWKVIAEKVCCSIIKCKKTLAGLDLPLRQRYNLIRAGYDTKEKVTAFVRDEAENVVRLRGMGKATAEIFFDRLDACGIDSSTARDLFPF